MKIFLMIACFYANTGWLQSPPAEMKTIEGCLGFVKLTEVTYPHCLAECVYSSKNLMDIYIKG
jgi:hypothetical protein